jgi:ferredoxin
MGKFGFIDRFCVPCIDDPVQMEFGTVEVDGEKCTGCSMCVDVCPAKALVITDEKAAMKPAPENGCAFCGDCAALCPAEAITLKTPFRFDGLFKTIHLGKPSPPRL